jgi:hypothetical protein
MEITSPVFSGRAVVSVVADLGAGIPTVILLRPWALELGANATVPNKAPRITIERFMVISCIDLVGLRVSVGWLR